MSRRLEQTLAAATLVLLVTLAIAAQFLTPESEAEAGSAESSEPEGRRALLLLLRELGFRAEAWNEAPGALPRGGGVVWMPRTPAMTFDLDDEEEEPAASTDEEAQPEASEPSPTDFGVRAHSHYRRFLEEGGTIVVRFDDRARRFLIDELGIGACEDVHVSRVAAAGARRVRDHRGEELELDVEEGGVLLPPPVGSSGEALWWGGTATAEGEDVLATMVPVGGGQLVLLGDDAFLANDQLGERDHALLAVRLAEEFARGGRVLFDEYALGLWRPRTAATLLASPKLLLATLQVALLLLLAFWSSAWVREFPRDPRGLESASPLLRARALGALLARAGRFDVLSRHLREGAMRRIGRRSRGVPEPLPGLEDVSCRSAAELERRNERLREIECRTS